MTAETINEVNERVYHDLIMILINTMIKDICNTSIVATGKVIDVLLDISNLTGEWYASETKVD